MLKTALKQAALSLPRVPAEAVFVGVTISGFTGLLVQDQVPAVLVLALQAFLFA